MTRLPDQDRADGIQRGLDSFISASWRHSVDPFDRPTRIAAANEDRPTPVECPCTGEPCCAHVCLHMCDREREEIEQAQP